MSVFGDSSSLLVVCEDRNVLSRVMTLAGSFGLFAAPQDPAAKKCCPSFHMAVLRGGDDMIDGETVMRLRDEIDEEYGFNSVVMHAFQDGRNAVSTFEIFT